jgi:acetyl esterase/lipase
MKSRNLYPDLMTLTYLGLMLIPKLIFAQNKADDFSLENFKMVKDVFYGADAEQNMDIYLSKEANSFTNRFTIVFLHGGGYYLNDKSNQEKYIKPYLEKGFNVVNMNYRLKRGIPLATEDLTNALNYLHENNSTFNLNLKRVVTSGFSAGAHIATLVGVTQNDSKYPNKLRVGIKIIGIVNFSGPIDGLDVVEKVFIENEVEIMRTIGNALFVTDGYAPDEIINEYEPITYLDKKDPAIFLWHGGKDDQVPPKTFESFVSQIKKNTKHVVIYDAEAGHNPNAQSLKTTYKEIFSFINKL